MLSWSLCCSGFQTEVAMKIEFDGEQENTLESVPLAKRVKASAKEKGEDYCRGYILFI